MHAVWLHQERESYSDRAIAWAYHDAAFQWSREVQCALPRPSLYAYARPRWSKGYDRPCESDE